LPRKRRDRATPLGEALKSYVKKSGIKRRLDQASVIPEWPELVGPKIAEVATPLAVTREGVLFVSVRSAAWMQELQLLSPEILRKLGSRGKKISRIVWRAE
jgi:predicted nucleic acid-binding Zn ribbon protein